MKDLCKKVEVLFSNRNKRNFFAKLIFINCNFYETCFWSLVKLNLFAKTLNLMIVNKFWMFYEWYYQIYYY